jgi:MoaA/NifB/PqqE/SkfB family radical SAM enzyme
MNTKRTDYEQLVINGIRDGTHSFTGPEHVVIDLTNRCNNNCIGCWTKSPLLGENRPDHSWHKQELETDLVLQLIDDLSDLGTSIIRFTGGGEPFLHQDIFKLIKAVKSRGMFCAVTTSLNMIDHFDADKIIDSGLDELSVSLWASNGDEYVATHPNKTQKTFAGITAVLKEIARTKQGRGLPFFSQGENRLPRVNILNVISKVNYTGIEAMYDYALEVQADSIYFAVIDIIEGSTESLLLSGRDRGFVSEACRRIEKKNTTMFGRQRLFLDNFAGFRNRINETGAHKGKYDEKRVEEIPCYIGWIFCRIMADGKVAPCCRGVNIPMGDLHENSFTDIWYSDRYNHFRKCAKNMQDHRSFFADVGCGKTCDNHMHNLDMHLRLKGKRD